MVEEGTTHACPATSRCPQGAVAIAPTTAEDTVTAPEVTGASTSSEPATRATGPAAAAASEASSPTVVVCCTAAAAADPPPPPPTKRMVLPPPPPPNAPLDHPMRLSL
jgi:hypothetical protein